MTAIRIIAEWLRDSAIAFALIIGGFFIGSALDQLWRTHSSVVSVADLCVGMIPFIWFARWRGAFTSTGRQYAALSIFIVAGQAIIVSLKAMFPDNRFVVDAFIIVAIAVVTTFFHWSRRASSPSQRSADSSSV